MTGIPQSFKRRAQQYARSLGWWITAEQLSTMWHQQNGQCAITGVPMALETATIDHIIPTSRGGSSELFNLRWATKAANRAKGDLLDDEFITLCRRVLQHLPATQETPDE